MGCGPSTNPNASEPEPQSHHHKKNQLQQLKHQKNINPDQITEAIIITEKKLR